MSHDHQQTDSRRINRRSVLASLGAAGAVSIAGCSQGGQGTDGSDKSGTILWAGSDAGVDGLLARVARDGEFAKNNGLNIKVKSMSASSLEAAIGQGQVDTGNMSVTVAARINNNTANKTLKCMRPLYRIHEQIVLHPDIADKVADDPKGGLGDLQDYKIGSLGEGSSVYNIFDLLVSQYGYDINKYDLRFLDPSAMVQQMIQGNLDAILSFDPPSSKLLARDEGYEILFEYSELWKDATGHELPIGEVTTYQNKIEGREEDWKALNQMWNDVGKYIKNNTNEVLREYRDHLGLENERQIEVAQDRMSNLFYDTFNKDARKGSRALVEQSVKAGVIEDADVDNLFLHPSDL